MKKTEAELRSFFAGNSEKDKRLLVLFFFIAAVLIADCLPMASLAPRYHYGVSEQQGRAVVVANTKPLPHGIQTLAAHIPITADMPPRLALFMGQPLPINRADQRTLALLPGIGPYRAAAIAAFIQTHGPLTSGEELQHIAGIGPKTVEQILPLIRFE